MSSRALDNRLIYAVEITFSSRKSMSYPSVGWLEWWSNRRESSTGDKVFIRFQIVRTRVYQWPNITSEGSDIFYLFYYFDISTSKEFIYCDITCIV